MPVFGTRPEAVKLAPVIRELRSRPDEFETVVVVTAQHRSMLDQVLKVFEIEPAHDLNLMQHGQTLAQVTSRALEGVQALIEQCQPEVVLVQGDTTTVFAGALAAFYCQVAVGHVEAGLRTSNKYNPFPEEMNRRLTTALTDLHFAPTPQARDNLFREGVPAERVYLTGNTVIDALLTAKDRIKPVAQPTGRMLLVTAHRRENLGEPMREICLGVSDLVHQFSDVHVVFAMHLNPKVREAVRDVLGGHERVDLIEPPDYDEFVALMARAHLILTDSGGVQEEAPALGKPVLVLRTTTERPEGVAAGTAKLVGPDRAAIVQSAAELLGDPAAYESMSQAANPYGDGRASHRIAEVLLHHFRGKPRPADWGGHA